MMDENEMLPFSDYVNTEKAAKMLGLSKRRLTDYINQDRLPSKRVGRVHFVRIVDVENLKLNPSGRKHKQPPAWRNYKNSGKVLATELVVPVRAGQQEALTERLQAIRDAEEHIFPGTIARYVVSDDPNLQTIRIWLLWKTVEMPSDEERQTHLSTFQGALADLLDWDTAHSQTTEVLLHT